MLTVVIPIYNEEKQIEKTVSVICEILQKASEQYQLVLVDDGSRDQTWQVLKSLADNITGIEDIRLRRNFGKEADIMAGLSERGKTPASSWMRPAAPAELIPQMLQLWKKGIEVVEAVKRTGPGKLFFTPGSLPVL